ncbi:MAG: hypothetical protein J2P45_00240 [Candidatus Dormibacteraeota bacterium]|nr:hypothetical protein [Candidatus Dormibacteraeota bacterium]
MFGKADEAAQSSEPQLDLGSQLEELLIHVFKCEEWAKLDDRIDLSVANWERAEARRRVDDKPG